MLIIVLLPFGLSLHLLFSDQETIFNFFGLAYDHVHNNNRSFMWYVLSGLIPILLLYIWFLTTWARWRYLILLVLPRYVYQLISAFRMDDPYWLHFTGSLVVILVLMLAESLRIQRAKGQADLKVAPYEVGVQRIKELYHKIKVYLRAVPRSSGNLREKNNLAKKMIHLQLVLSDEIARYQVVDAPRFLGRKVSMSIVFILFGLAIFNFVFLFIPRGQQEIDLLILNIGNSGFLDVRTNIWYFSLKFVFLAAMSIWFLSCSRWWRYAIFSPIVMSTYQLWEAFYPGATEVDELSYMKALPLILGVTVLLLLISRAINYRSKILDIHEEICSEIDQLFKEMRFMENDLNLWREKFDSIKKEPMTKKSAKENLNSLLELRHELKVEIDRINE